MSKTRKYIPKDLQRKLFIECGFKCSMNRCDREVSLEIHHIDSNPSNNSPDNLIVLCSVHHDMAHNGKLDPKICEFLKKSLQEINYLSGKSIEITSRNDFFNLTINSLRKSQELRATFVGPTFIRPEFLKKVRNSKKATNDLDQAFIDFCSSNYTRVIFRNNNRFKEKIEEYLDTNAKRKRYVEEMLCLLEKIKENTSFNKFSFCCVDTGFYKIDFIMNNCLITSYRNTSSSPIEKGIMYTDINEITRSKHIFDNIFDKCYRGKEIEYAELHNYIKNLF